MICATVKKKKRNYYEENEIMNDNYSLISKLPLKN